MRKEKREAAPLSWAKLETLTTRLGDDFFRRSNRQFVKRKWPRWFTPNCISNPSSVCHFGQPITPKSQNISLFDTSQLRIWTPSQRCRNISHHHMSFIYLPALLMRTSSLSSLARTSSASCRTDCRDAKSNFLTITFSFPLLFLTSSAALLVLSMSLQARMTLAPVRQQQILFPNKIRWLKTRMQNPDKALTPCSQVNSGFFANSSVASGDQDGLSIQPDFAVTHSTCIPFLHTEKSHSCGKAHTVRVKHYLHILHSKLLPTTLIINFNKMPNIWLKNDKLKDDKCLKLKLKLVPASQT